MRLDRYDQGGYAGGGITENGGNISGPLVLAGNPSQTLEAVPKQYVDAYFNSLNASNLTAGTLAAARLPNFTGDLQSVAGTSQLTLANSGVVAGEHGKVTVNGKGIVTSGGNISDVDIPFGLGWDKINAASLPSTLSGYGITNAINISGGTLTGFLSVANQPTLNTHVATKQYVDALVSGGGIAVGDILRKPYSNTPVGFLKCNGAEVSKTTYADLYAKIGDQYQENTMSGSGKPWLYQYDINATQSGDITGWTADTGLPYYVAYSNTIVTKNRVYVIGGHTNTVPTNAVYYATLNADGTLGTWTAGTALPAATFQNEVIVIKNRVYVFGGNNASNTATLATVYSTVINADGSLGSSWTTEASLPYAVGGMGVFTTKNRVYLVGGFNGGTYLNTVIYATINSDGTLGTWNYSGNLPWVFSQGQLVVIKNKVYIVGGAFTAGGVSGNIYCATINTDESLGTWSFVGSMPGPLCVAEVFVTKNTLYVLGGHNGSAYVATVYYCSVNQDGTLGTWTVGTSLALATGYAAAAVGQNRIYMIAGFNGGYLSNVYSAPILGGSNDYSSYYAVDSTNYQMPGSGQPWVQQYAINNTQVNDISGWTAVTNFPTAIENGAVVVTKNYVYYLGGVVTGTTPVNTTYRASINSDGTLGAWTLDANLPIAIASFTVIVIKNRVYMFGGSDNVTMQTAIRTAPINSDGTIGTWTSTQSIPVGLSYASIFVTKNRIYIVGGWNGSTYFNTVYTAAINTDGTFGTWLTSTAFPTAIMWSSVVVTKNRVYMIGGHNGSSMLNTIYSATINSDGIIGPWVSVGTLPTTHGYSQPFVTKNRVYLISGSNGSSNINSIYYASISEDGTISSTWTQSAVIPFGNYFHKVFATNSKIYSIGGFNGATKMNTVHMASILEGLNDYSPYYDGTILPTEPVLSSTKFTLPDLTADELSGSYSYIKY